MPGTIANLLGLPSVFVSDDPEGWIYADGAWARQSDSGIRVTPMSALGLPAYFACIRNISEDIGKLPFIVYKGQRGEERERMPEHPAYPLIHVEPNPAMTAMSQREAITGHALGWGGGFAEIERDGGGRPTAINGPIHPSRIGITRKKVNGRPSYGLTYLVKTDDIGWDKGIVILSENMIHIHGFGGDGCTGYGLSAMGADAIGMGLAAQKFGGRFFANGVRMSGVLEHPGKPTPEARRLLSESWAKAYGGAENVGKAPLLEEGIQWKQTSIPPDEAQFLQTRHLQIEELSRMFRMSPHKIQHLLRATFSNITHQSMEYVTDCLMSWAVRWEQEVKRKLFRGEPDVYAEILFTALLRGDPKERAEFYTKRFQSGSLSINEIKRLENEDPIGPAGDTHFVQVNMQPVEQFMQKPEAEPGPAKQLAAAPGEEEERPNRSLVRQAHLPMIEDAMKRVITKATKATERAAKKYTDAAGEFGAWADKFYAEHKRYVVDALTAPAMSYALLEADGRDVEGAVTRAVHDYAAFHVQAETTIVKLAYDTGGGIEEWADHRSGAKAARCALSILDTLDRALKQESENHDAGTDTAEG